MNIFPKLNRIEKNPDTCLKPPLTLPETNIAPKNRPSQKESSIPTIHFQVRKC